jgi:CDP-diacylglycerol--serine O-phosphatidyltransferase
MTLPAASVRSSPATSFHASNLLTYAALAAGLAAIASAVGGSAHGAGAFLALAALADTFDGRFARLFDRDPHTKAMGAELDSLTDAVAFGVAPVACLGILLEPASNGPWMAWWVAASLYTGCALTRLAYYNVSQAAHATSTFVGLPAPIAALVWSSLLVTTPDLVRASVIAAGLGAAMIAPMSIGRPGPAGLTVFALWPLVLVAVHVGLR